MVQLSWSIRASYLEFRFNENFTHADIPFFIFGIQVSTWTITKLDEEGHLFLRGYYNSSGGLMPEYTIFKVIDYDGTKLPAFDKMVQTTHNGTHIIDIPGIVVMANGASSSSPQNSKTAQQIVVGQVGVGSVVLAVVLCLSYLTCCINCFSPTYINPKCTGIKVLATDQEP